MFAATKAAFHKPGDAADPTVVFLLAAGASNTVYDAGPNGLTVTNTNATTTTGETNFSGKYSVSFNGTDSYLRLPNDAVFSLGTGDFTIELWVKPDNITGLQNFGIGPGDGTNNWLFFRAFNASLQLGIAGTFIGSATDTVEAGVWQHLAASREGSSVRYFKNGTQVGSTITNTGNIDVASYQPIIGALVPGSPPTNPFNGYIQDLRLSNTARYTGTFTPPGSLT